MQPMRIRPKSDALLALASGEELLWLMAMSNLAMRRQIRRELDSRAACGVQRQPRPARYELLRAA